jgi:DNA-binding CsgD family transcriptional regulator
VRHLVARHPAVRVVALAIGDNEGDVCGWASLGVAGFLTTTDSLDDLAQCIAAVGRGEFCCSPRHASMLLRRVATLSRDAGGAATHDGLTQRQAEIVALMRARMSNKLIARHLGIELATLKNHVHQILQRLNLRSRGEVAMSGPPTSCGTLHDAVMFPDPKARQRPSLNPSLVLAPRGTSHCPSEPIGTRPPAMRSLLRSVQSPYRPAGRLAPDRDP